MAGCRKVPFSEACGLFLTGFQKELSWKHSLGKSGPQPNHYLVRVIRIVPALVELSSKNLVDA